MFCESHRKLLCCTRNIEIRMPPMRIRKKKGFRWIDEKCILTKSIAHRKYAGNLRMNTCQGHREKNQCRQFEIENLCVHGAHGVWTKTPFNK
jgi:hypothetical protein